MNKPIINIADVTLEPRPPGMSPKDGLHRHAHRRPQARL